MTRPKDTILQDLAREKEHLAQLARAHADSGCAHRVPPGGTRRDPDAIRHRQARLVGHDSPDPG